MKRQMTCVLLDNDFDSLETLKYYASQIPYLLVLNSFSDSIVAMNWLRENKVDLLITDIDMPGKNGIEMVGSLSDKPLVILFSGYPEYAYEGFTIKALEFLKKPVSFKTFEASIEHAADRLSINLEKGLKKKHEFYFFYDVNLEADIKVDFDDIQYVEPDVDSKINIFCLNDIVINTRMPMNAILELLPSEDFMRIHRSTIIALDLIDIFKNGTVFLIDVPKGLTVGGEYSKDLYDYINERKYKKPKKE